MSEFLYVLENPSMPGLVKIGRTERSVSERVSELSSPTGVPTGFIITKEYPVEDCAEAERLVHERLAEYRVAENREFFRLEAESATEIIDSMLEVAKCRPQRDFEREDELIARAIPLVVQHGLARPRMLEEELGVSHEEALFIMEALRGRGVTDEQNASRWGAKPAPPRAAAQPDRIPPVISEYAARAAQGTRAPLVTPDTDPRLRPVHRKPKPITVASTPMIGNYWLPPMDLLQGPAPNLKPTDSKEDLMAKARLLQATLAQFDIEVALGDITKGPRLTRYELHAAPGVRLDQIVALSRELASALQVEQVDVLAPIPGKSSVGVDVPNAVTTEVILRDVLESVEWRNTRARIPVALGKDVWGNPLVADLSEMPHLVLSGQPGSGKSLCLDAMIMSLLYRFSPDQLRFVMIDPEGIGLRLYNGIPHLVVPVLEIAEKATLALRWAVTETQMRYQIFARVGVRNIGSFNSRFTNKPLPPSTTEEGIEPAPNCFAMDIDEQIVVPREEDIVIPEKLSCIVVIVENMPALLNVVRPEIEAAVQYLVRNGKSAGVHLVLTTRSLNQYGMSEGVWEEIRARLAFRCASRAESRSAIGQEGAEKLLGKGDMLYLPPGSGIVSRIQGPHVAESEIRNVVDFITNQAGPSYELEIQRQLSPGGREPIEGSGMEEDEEVIQDCIEVIRSEQKASVALLQRRLRLGYGRAAQIMDELEARGIVGPSKGAEPRDILIDLDPCQGSDEPTAEEATSVEPRLARWACQSCGGKLEFDANELAGRESVAIPCPHCGAEIVISDPSRER